MITEDQVITIKKVKYSGEYKLSLLFNDDTEQTVDLYPFLTNSLNPLIRKYLDLNKFIKFKLESGDLQWNDYDLCFPIADLYENNIKLHYVEYLERYVNVVWKKKFLIEKIRKLKKNKQERNSSINRLCSNLRRIKNDILKGKYKSESSYHDWIKEQKKHILPNKDKFKKDSV